MNCCCTMQGRSEEEEEFRKFLKGEASGRESSRGWEKRSKERETDHQGKQRLQKYASDELPQHYRGYEALLVKDSVPAPPIPTGGSHSLCLDLPHIIQCKGAYITGFWFHFYLSNSL